MKFTNSLSATLLMATVVWSASGFAAENPEKVWSGEASLTYLLKNGNTESSTLGAKLRAEQDLSRFRFTYQLEGSNQETDDVRTEEKYFASTKADWKFWEHTYAFLLLEHEDDRFAGYDYQTTLSAGLGHTALDTDTHKLSLEFGPGYRRTKVMADAVNEEATARAALNYAWQVSESAKLTQNISSEWGDDATLTRSQTQLKAKINSKLSMTLGYDVRNLSRVEVGAKKTDTTTYVSLDYSF